MRGQGNGNATVPQGFDELKRALSVRYPEGAELSLRDFLDVESALALLVRICGLDADPSKADRLLSNYQLIRPGAIGPDEHLMQMARRHLFSLVSATTWRRLLALYEREDYAPFRFFETAKGAVSLRPEPFAGINRVPIYIERLLCDSDPPRNVAIAKPGCRYSYTSKPEAVDDGPVAGTLRWVTMPSELPVPSARIGDASRKLRRNPIRVTLGELIATAEEVGEKTGRTYYATVLRQVKELGLLKRAQSGSAVAADELSLEEVVSLVGLVGAGKSVLVPCSSFVLRNAATGWFRCSIRCRM